MHTLLASSLLGIIWLAVIFVLCFVGVHVLRLARLGQAYRKQQSQPPPPSTPQKDEKETKIEPVYYIVERKRRKKPTLSEPKRIQFSINDHNNRP